jgi:uncharacterized protein
VSKGDGGESPSLLSFPCDFNIKVMGKNSSEFPNRVADIVRQYFPEFNADQIQKRFSRFTNYMSLTITVHAQSQKQLDDLYRHLTSTPEILIVI